jgi:hypothetical protein
MTSKELLTQGQALINAGNQLLKAAKEIEKIEKLNIFKFSSQPASQPARKTQKTKVKNKKNVKKQSIDLKPLIESGNKIAQAGSEIANKLNKK